MSRATTWDISSIMTLYFARLLVAGPRYMTLKLTSSFFGKKMTKAVEAIFQVCRLPLIA